MFKSILKNRNARSGEPNTELTYSFPDNKVSDFVRLLFDYAKQVDNVLAVSLLEKFRLGIEYYFRTYSYAGNVSRLLGMAEIKVVDIGIYINL